MRERDRDAASKSHGLPWVWERKKMTNREVVTLDFRMKKKVAALRQRTPGDAYTIIREIERNITTTRWGVPTAGSYTHITCLLITTPRRARKKAERWLADRWTNIQTEIGGEDNIYMFNAHNERRRCNNKSRKRILDYIDMIQSQKVTSPRAQDDAPNRSQWWKIWYYTHA